jgi:hypothetical protein
MLAAWHEMPQSQVVNALRLVGKQATKALGCEPECLYRSLNFIGVGIHGVREAA